MATQKKIDTVSALTDKISRAKAIVLADYRGLKHKQLEELRKLLKSRGAICGPNSAKNSAAPGLSLIKDMSS